MLLAGLPDRGRGAVGIAHVAADRNAADAAGHLARGVDIHVEQRDLGAVARKLGGGRGAEPRSRAGDDGGLSVHIHGEHPPAPARRRNDAMLYTRGAKRVKEAARVRVVRDTPARPARTPNINVKPAVQHA